MTADPDGALAAIRAREQAATPGPWTHHEFGHYHEHEPSSIVVVQGDGPDWWSKANHGDYIADFAWDSQGGDDARFIANAREDVPALVNAVAAVLTICDEWQAGEWDESPRPRDFRAVITDALGGAR